MKHIKEFTEFKSINEAETYFDFFRKEMGDPTFVDMLKYRRPMFKNPANVKREADILEPVMKYLKVTKLEDMKLVAMSAFGFDQDKALKADSEWDAMIPGDRSWMKKFKTKEVLKIKKMSAYSGKDRSKVELGTLYGKPTVMFISFPGGQMDFEAFSKK